MGRATRRRLVLCSAGARSRAGRAGGRELGVGPFYCRAATRCTWTKSSFRIEESLRRPRRICARLRVAHESGITPELLESPEGGAAARALGPTCATPVGRQELQATASPVSGATSRQRRLSSRAIWSPAQCGRVDRVTTAAAARPGHGQTRCPSARLVGSAGALFRRLRVRRSRTVRHVHGGESHRRRRHGPARSVAR